MIWWSKRTILLAAVIVALAAVSWKDTGIDLSLVAKFSNLLDFIGKEWLPPDWRVLGDAIHESLITMEIAFLATLFALLAALPLSFLAAGNIASPATRGIVRSVLSFLRSIPEMVLGLLFVVVVGLGPFPAILAILLHNIGVLGKLISELVEAADRTPQEALRAAGASSRMVALYAVLPQIWPNVLSQYFYRLEVAIRTSLILGFIGAGGIGQQLYMHFKIFDYDKVTVDVLAIMALVIITDALSTFVRRRII